ncbi:MAG: Omp28-related outer membrane protein, partial [Bacteroidetes bacterium]|nr:Omp28-related outer membrane protein [Bacteroidota bacterium]
RKTFGTAPNRQHWIVFSSYTAAAGCYTYWGIALEETTNNIYLVDMRNGGCALNLTLGVQINSTTATSVYGSPNVHQLASSDATPADNSYYKFMMGSLPTSNAALASLSNAHYTFPSTNVNIGGTITNFGSTPITTITIKYKSGANTYTDTKTGLSIASYASYSFTHATPFFVASATGYPIKVWVELTSDADHTNDTLNTMISGLTFVPQKNIVFEEGTGTWCGWCPRGAVFMDSLKHTHPTKVNLIAVHDGDQMMDNAYDAGVGALISGYPSGLVDRKINDEDPSNFLDLYDTRITDTVPCEVFVNTSFNSTTRLLTVHVNGHFAASLDGDYRFNAVITEDGVTGTGDGTATNNLDYDQTNYYSFQNQNIALVGAGHDWQAETDPVPATNMVFDHVARSILGGFDGQAGSLPASIHADSTYSYTFTYTVPSSSNVLNLITIGWVCDASTGEIFNSNRAVAVGINELSNPHHFMIYPNPSTGIIHIKSADAGNERMKVNVMNSLGMLVASYEKMNFTGGQSIDLSKQSNGLYFIQFTDESNRSSVSKVMINR